MSDRSTVLVLTAAEDPTADAVVAELARRDARVARFDSGDFPGRLHLAAALGSGGWTGRLYDATASVQLEQVRAVYYRRPTQFRVADGLSAGDTVFAVAEARRGFGGVLLSLDALWVNDPTRIAVAEYKPLQLKLAARLGLPVPLTVITNDHIAARDFAEQAAGPVICKSLSSVLLADAAGLKMTYTTEVDPADLVPAEVGVTATLLQEQVPKAFDVRVTVVADRAFAVAIHTDSPQGRVDWRADYDALSYRRIEVPRSVVNGMAGYLSALGLNFGAFDFAVTPQDQWVMLECNPAGQWLWLEHETGAPSAAALADLLASGSSV